MASIPNSPSSHLQQLLVDEGFSVDALSGAEARALLGELRDRYHECNAQRERLAAERNTFADFFDFAPIGYLILSTDGTIHDANLHSAQMLGQAKSDLIGQALVDFVAEEDRTKFNDHVECLADTLEVQTCEVRILPDDYADYFVLMESRRFEDPSHGLRYFVALTDITERRRSSAERARLFEEKTQIDRDKQEAQAILRALVDSVPVGLAVMDTEIRYLHVNQALADINGIPREAHFGKTAQEIMPDFEHDELTRAIRYVLERRKPMRMEFTGKTPAYDADDEPGHWIVYYFPVMLADELLGVGTAVMDITQRYRTERALLESQEQLRQNEARFRVALRNAPIAVFSQDTDLRYTWAAGEINRFNEGTLVGQRDTDFLTSPEGRAVIALKERILQEGLSLQEEVMLPGKNGEAYYYILTLEPFYAANREVAGLIGAATDITENRRTTIAEHQQRLLAETLLETAYAINRSLNLPDVLDNILAGMGRVVPHDVAEVILFDDEALHVERGQGYAALDMHTGLINVGDTVAESPILQDIITNRSYVVHSDARGAAWLSTPRVRSYIGVPLMWQDAVIGVLNLGSEQAGFFQEPHARRLQGFAALSAMAIRNAQLHEQAQHVATLEERQRLARDLHDAVSQMLFTSNLVAETLAITLEKDPASAPEHLGKLRVLNRGALAEMRMLLAELRPAELEKAALKQLLEQLSQAVEGRTHVAVDLVVDDGVTLPPPVQVAFYRVAQEALNNVVKYARAGYVKVSLLQKGGGVRLSIEDDGVGFDPALAMQKSMGLSIMHERMTEAGGTLEIDSAVGAGTIITAVWVPS
ncbi:MAG: PAS domain-containing protein [Anaerolineales bacterium]